MIEKVQYLGSYAGRVMDAFGVTGFKVSGDGHLRFTGPGGGWRVDPGGWIVRANDGTLCIKSDHSKACRIVRRVLD